MDQEGEAGNGSRPTVTGEEARKTVREGLESAALAQQKFKNKARIPIRQFNLLKVAKGMAYATEPTIYSLAKTRTESETSYSVIYENCKVVADYEASQEGDEKPLLTKEVAGYISEIYNKTIDIVENVCSYESVPEELEAFFERLGAN